MLQLVKYQRQLLAVSRRFSAISNFSTSSPSQAEDKDCDESRPWLDMKAGPEISSKLHIGKSPFGRGLFASQRLRRGECLLAVPFTWPCHWNYFAISGKTRGIPQSLSAFLRVASCNDLQELRDLADEAEENGGRLAWLPFKDREREIRAHIVLLPPIILQIGHYRASIQAIDHSSCDFRHPTRVQLASSLLADELRILESTSAWLQKYCATRSTVPGDGIKYNSSIIVNFAVKICENIL